MPLHPLLTEKISKIYVRIIKRGADGQQIVCSHWDLKGTSHV